MIWLGKLAKLAPYVPLAVELVRSWAGVAIEKYRARKAEEERKKAEAERNTNVGKPAEPMRD